ncbi:unnamed protein product [Penicillium salamii]|uniref:RING-type E3 ubiquitin transferase n=1 Tax=Penicillium salamii TaxID=1612424 RepID=A0A9W4JGD7_9EURO|nr:unnamed protein product [Penicillium salamii]CAG7975083.1 unnamed protein product [Penicillium salamii]CAG8187425.1 unnamed protein product [Penicillium salamii]CAG8199468.1 unnamed protein product [Penicillium salamii]CAG8205229.1 unnamed protein product [Penicillium salamii]
MDGNRIHCYACDVVSPKGPDLLCPNCHSDFTEIVEIPPETETPEPARSRPDPWGDNSPWEEEDNTGFMSFRASPPSSFRTYRSPDGRFQFSSATINSRSNDQQNTTADPLGMMLLQNIHSILGSMADPQERPHRMRGMGENPFLSSTDPDWLHDDHLTGHHPGMPREADNARINHLRNMHNLINAGHAQRGAENIHVGPGGPGNPFQLISALLNMPPQLRNADAAYSQAEYDRLLSQLMETHGETGTAAPPASRSAIRALPRKKVDQEMIGPEGNAECSICMETVALDTEVTVLPCTHWFHFDCIEAWLKQHDTCPHCRRGISENTSEGSTCDNPVVIPDSPESSRRRSSANAPRTSRNGRSSVSSMQHGFTRRYTPPEISSDPETGEPTAARRPSRGEGSGSISSWFSNRFGSSA